MKCSPGIRLVACILVIALALVVVSGCVLFQQRSVGMPQAGEYAFLEHQTYYHGTLVSGKCPPFALNISTYRLDADNKTLEGLVSFGLNDSLVLIYGESTVLSGDYGNGGSGLLSGAYALPYTSGNLNVTGFTADGTMYLTYHNQTLALEPGTRWTDISTGTETTTACTMNRTVTDTITYYGNFPMSEVKKMAII